MTWQDVVFSTVVCITICVCKYVSSKYPNSDNDD